MANVPSSPILVNLMMEALCSSETSILTRVTRRNIPEDAIRPYVSIVPDMINTHISSDEQSIYIYCDMLPKGGFSSGFHTASNMEIVRFEVFTAVTMKNGVFWVVTPCGSCKNRRFGGT
jgi:hypothetical protein